MVTPTRIEPVTPTPTLPHQGGGNQRGRGPEATLEDPTKSAQLIADLQCQLAECAAERDEPRAQRAAISKVQGVVSCSPVRATRFTHPPPRWGRVGVGVTDRLAVGVVMPRTDPW